MGDFKFLDEENPVCSNSSTVEEDHAAIYFKMRQQIRQDSLSSNRMSSLSLLSLSNNSISNDPLSSEKNVSRSSLPVFKKPKTPVKRETAQRPLSEVEKWLEAELAKADDVISRVKPLKNKSDDVGAPSRKSETFASSWSPVTPKAFRDSMASIMPDATPSISTVNFKDSLADFPLRNEDDVLNLLEKEEKKFIPNTSGFSHNSDISQFSCRTSSVAKTSIGDFFNIRSNSVNSITGEKEKHVSDSLQDDKENTITNQSTKESGQSTISAIHNLLGAEELSATAICEKLLLNRQPTVSNGRSIMRDLTLESSRLDGLSQSRQSTPLASRVRPLPSAANYSEATPMRKGREWNLRRCPLNSSTPLLTTYTKSDMLPADDDEKQIWQQLRKTQLEETEEESKETREEDAGEELELTIAAGDLTILSQRISQNSLSPAGPINSPLLNIVNKLVDFPAGTVDCSALTPLIRSEHPELLVEWDMVEARRASAVFSVGPSSILSSHQDDWMELSSQPQVVNACVKTNKLVPLPMASKNLWLIVRVLGIQLNMNNKVSQLELLDDEFVLENVAVIKTKMVVLPPGVEHQLGLSIVCQKVIKSLVTVELQATNLLTGESKSYPTRFFLKSSLAAEGFTFLPSSVSFGTLPETCYDDRQFKLTYSGTCDVPVVISISEKNTTKNFFISKSVKLNGEITKNCVLSDGVIQTTLSGGKKQILEFTVRFSPADLPNIAEKRSVDLEGELRVDLVTTESPGLMVARSRLHGAVAFAKFLCRADCSPVVFQADVPGVPVTKTFYLKNVGAIPLKVALRVTEDLNKTQLDTSDTIFTVPSMVALPLDEQVSFNICFNPPPRENYSKRYLIMNLEPNGRNNYDAELIGTVSTRSDEARCSSRSSVKSGSTAMSVASESCGFPVKIQASRLALSWISTPLQKSVVENFQVKIKAQAAATARISVSRDTDAFKIINEKGDALSKLCKTLKPDVPVTLNVQFKPDSIGLHQSILSFKFNTASNPSNISLTGFGGCPKLQIEGTLLDLHGNRMVKLVHPNFESFTYASQFRITNYGNVPGFVLITPNSNVLSVAHALKVFPVQAVVEPNSNVIIHLSQHLTRPELRDILNGREIRKLATLNVILGDESSRMRLRRHLSLQRGLKSEQNRKLVENFPGEKKMNLDDIKESKEFETLFLNSLTSTDVVAVVEKQGETEDETVLDMDETSEIFTSLCDTMIVRQNDPPTQFVDNRRSKSRNTSYASASSQDVSSKRVQDWLKRVE